MKQGLKLKLLVSSFAMLTSCSSVLEELSGDKIGYTPAACSAIKSRCADGHFSSWPTSDGREGCSCNLSKAEQQTGTTPAGW